MKSEGIAAPRPGRGEGSGGRRGGPGREGGAAASAAPGWGGETPAGERAALLTSGPRIGPGRARPGELCSPSGPGHCHPPPLTGTGCCQQNAPDRPLRYRSAPAPGAGEGARTRNPRAGGPRMRPGGRGTAATEQPTGALGAPAPSCPHRQRRTAPALPADTGRGGGSRLEEPPRGLGGRKRPERDGQGERPLRENEHGPLGSPRR